MTRGPGIPRDKKPGAKARRASASRRPTLVPSFDGSPIGAYRLEGGQGTPVLVCNSVGATLRAWGGSLTAVLEARRGITWDHRGLHASGGPRSDRMDPAAQADDAIAVVDHFGIDRFVLCAWSTGGRIALEIAHRYPERVESMALVCGGYGYSLIQLFRNFEVASVLPTAAGIAKQFSPVVGAALKAVAGRPEAGALMRHSGLVGATEDTAGLVQLLEDVAACDPRRLLDSYEAVAGSAAPDLPGRIQAAALVVAGERDQFAPRRMLEEMARAMPAARLEVFEGASHFLPLEFPRRLGAELHGFFERRL